MRVGVVSADDAFTRRVHVSAGDEDEAKEERELINIHETRAFDLISLRLQASVSLLLHSFSLSWQAFATEGEFEQRNPEAGTQCVSHTETGKNGGKVIKDERRILSSNATSCHPGN